MPEAADLLIDATTANDVVDVDANKTISDVYRRLADPAGCSCCGENCPYCCPAEIGTKAFCYHVNISDIYYGGVHYPLALAYKLTAYLDGCCLTSALGGYEIRDTVDLGGGVSLNITLATVLACRYPGTTLLERTWVALTQLIITPNATDINSLTSVASAGGSLAACADDIEAIAAGFDTGTPPPPFSNALRAVGSMAIDPGTCTSPNVMCTNYCPDPPVAHPELCCGPCCNDNSSWFGSGVIPAVLYITFSGPPPDPGYSGQLGRSCLQANGNCIQWASGGLLPFNRVIMIQCDGTIVMCTTDVSSACHYAVVGGITVVNSTSPLDVDFAITSGDLAGTAFKVTE